MSAETDSNVLGVVMVIRSGDRLYEPQIAYEVDHVSGAGLLTPLGEQQELQLGNLLRSTYLDPTSSSFIYGFTGTSLYNASEVIINADGSPTSGAPFDSAVALAQGLWPPTGADSIQLANGSTIISPFGGYQYVEVEAVSPADSPSLNGAILCTTFWNRVAQVLHTTPVSEEPGSQVTQLLLQLKQFVPPDYAHFSDNDAEATALYYLGDVFDYMNVQSIHNASYARSLPSDSLAQVRSLNDWLVYNLFTDPGPGGIGNIAGLSIMWSILDALSDIQNPTNGLKMAINVVTYQPFLSLMNITGITQSANLPEGLVDYASALVFELRNSSSGTTVRVQFKNGTDDRSFHTFGMVFSNWTGSGEDVPYDTFTSYFSSLLGLPNFASTWCNACGSPSIDLCIVANLTDALLNATQASGGIPGSPSVTGIVQVTSAAQATAARDRIGPVGAGFLGAGLTAALLGALFAFLLFLGVLPQGSGARKLRRYSLSGSYRREKRRGDELELRSEVNSIVGVPL